MAPADFAPISLPTAKLTAPSFLELLLGYTPVKALLPVPILLLVAPALYFLFRKTWEELNREARANWAERDGIDYRPMVALSLVAVVLTVQEYFGGRAFFNDVLAPVLEDMEREGASYLKVRLYRDLYGYGWWVTARVLGYVVCPLVVWRIVFPKDSVLDMGLRAKGFFSHLGIYGLCLLAVFVGMAGISTQSDFLNYYPFYKSASRSWFDYLAWEGMYFVQFFALEFFFRGWLLEALRRSMGAAAIFVMAPYCMIHYGKPYFEAHGAILAGIALGSLAMKTRSVYAGFLVHITVAGIMDALALASRGGFPKTFWP